MFPVGIGVPTVIFPHILSMVFVGLSTETLLKIGVAMPAIILGAF